jgi:hypothetical protein
MKPDVLDQLFDIRDRLSDLLIELKPETAEEREEFNRLQRRRDGITGAIAQIIATDFKNSGPDLARMIDDLEARAKDLCKVKKTIDGVKDGIQIADQVAQLVTAIIKLVL